MLAVLLFATTCLSGVSAQARATARSLPSSHLASTPSPGPAAPLGGVNADGFSPAEANRVVASARALHAQLIRTEVPWAEFEPTGPERLNASVLAYLDRLMSDAKAAGIGVIMLVDDTPCWASSAPATLLASCKPQHRSQANSWPPANPADFAKFVTYLTQRYGPDLTAIEIWNEPDQINEDYFAGPNKAVRYAALLRAAYPAIKQADPTVKVLAGSLVGYNGVFLRSLYAAGIKGYYDGIAVHFYSLTLASLRTFRSVELASGDRTPLWLDEFGWSSCYPQARSEDEQACVTAKVQAANVASLYRELSHTAYIAAITLFKLQDSHSQFGVLTARGAHKPAYSALAQALRSPFGAPAPVTLALRRRGASVLASGSGPVGDYMNIEVRVHGIPRYRAQFTLERFNRYAIVLPSALGTHGLSVLVYQTWAGPAKGARKSI